MGILADAKGKAIKKITANNLGAYKKWLLTDENPQYKNLSVDKNVALADIAVFADLSETQTEVVASLISKTLKSNERLNEFIDLAKQNPKVVAQVYRKYAQGKLLNKINNTLGERLSSENLAFGLALTDNGSIISNVGRPDGFGKISAENKKRTEELLASAFKHYNRQDGMYERFDKFELAADYVEKLVQQGSLVNLETDRKRREFIYKRIIENYGLAHKEILDVLDPKYIDRYLIKKMMYLYGMMPDYKDTSNAVTQAEKNINILPKGYIKLKQAVMNDLEKSEYSHEKFGYKLGLNERFCRMMKAFGIKRYLYSQPEFLGGLYLATARKDFEQSGLKYLDDTALTAVLIEKGGEKYYKMLSKDDKEYVDNNLLGAANVHKQYFLSRLKDDNLDLYTVQMLQEINYSTRESKKILVRLDKEQEKITHKIQQLKQNESDGDELKELQNLSEAIKETHSALFTKVVKKIETAKNLIGLPNKSAVQAVPQNAEKVEKAQIRRKNKQVEDKLAVKEKEFTGKSIAEKIFLQKQRQNQAMR